MSLNKLDLSPENGANNLSILLEDQIRNLQYHLSIAWRNLIGISGNDEQIDVNQVVASLDDSDSSPEKTQRRAAFNQLLHLYRCYGPLTEVTKKYLQYKNAAEDKETCLENFMQLVADDENGLRAIYRFFVKGLPYQCPPRTVLKDLAAFITILNESMKDEFGINSQLRNPAYTTGEPNAPYISRVLDRDAVRQFNEKLKAALKELEDEVVRMITIDLLRAKYWLVFGMSPSWESARERFHNNPTLVPLEKSKIG